MTDAHALECLREAGRIASRPLAGARRVRPGASLREVCVAVEDEIERRGEARVPRAVLPQSRGGHYCAAPDDATVYAGGDLAKLDLGVHVERLGGGHRAHA